MKTKPKNLHSHVRVALPPHVRVDGRNLPSLVRVDGPKNLPSLVRVLYRNSIPGQQLGSELEGISVEGTQKGESLSGWGIVAGDKPWLASVADKRTRERQNHSGKTNGAAGS